MDVDCGFCKIINGQGSARVVRRWASGMAFIPLEPATPGHTLVVPFRHVRDLWDADPDLAADVVSYSLELAKLIRDALLPDGMNIINSAGAAATQTVMHLHIHLVPRYVGDKMGPIWPESGVSDVEGELAYEKLVKAIEA